MSDSKRGPVKACGVLVVKGTPVQEFLLMRHVDRWDLPKGHLDPGESDTECALRELEEETGIPAAAVDLDPDFRFTTTYRVIDRKEGECDKLLVVYLGRLNREVEIRVSEHPDYQWFPWPVAGSIQSRTIDPLLETLRQFLK